MNADPTPTMVIWAAFAVIFTGIVVLVMVIATAFQQRNAMRGVLHLVVDNPSTSDGIRNEALRVLGEDMSASFERRKAHLESIRKDLRATPNVHQAALADLECLEQTSK